MSDGVGDPRRHKVRGDLLASRYEIGGLLGQGGMGDVYAATDTFLERRVAIKVLRSGFARDPEALTRFHREARTVASLDHSGFVTVFDVREDDRGPFIVMELVNGESLEELLREVGSLQPRRAAEIGRAVAGAIAVAHAAGVVHRDLKPGNIMTSVGGQVKILDFGIARVQAWTPLTSGRVVQGTAEYVSPEQARGESLDGRSDIYSLGILLYEMLTGRPPFTCDSPVAVLYKHLEETPESPSSVQPQVPPELSDVVLRCLKKDPAERFETAGDLCGALGAFLDSPGGVPVAAARGLAVTGRMMPQRPTRRFRRLHPKRGPAQRPRARRVVLTAVAMSGAVAVGALVPNLLGREGAANAGARRPVLTPPTAVEVTSECGGFVSADTVVSWSASSSPAVVGYAVYRSTEGGPYEMVATMAGPTATLFRDEGLDTGTSYHYRIRSTAGARAGSYSETAGIGTPVLCMW